MTNSKPIPTEVFNHVKFGNGAKPGASLKVDNGPFNGKSGYTLIDNKWTDLIRYADGQIYSDGPQCYLMVFMDGDLNAVVSPIDTDVSNRIKELRQGVRL